jgi:hypothetical protein
VSVSNLELGRVAGTLLVKLVRGDTFTVALRYTKDGLPAPWPSAPVMTLGGINYVLTLSDTLEVAALVIPAEEVDTIAESGIKKAELNVGTTETWRGRILVT